MALRKTLRSSAGIIAACLLLTACSTPPEKANPIPRNQAGYPQQGTQAGQQGDTYDRNELVDAISTHLGVTAESAGSAVERMFADRGRPVGYITGEEGGGALIFGARYGEGTLWMKDGRTQKVYWQGPSVGFDAGAEVSKVFTLVYDLKDPEYIFRRFPGIDGSAYLVAGLAVNYQAANGVTLAPVRSGVGLRLGANVGYTSYTRKSKILPF